MATYRVLNPHGDVVDTKEVHEAIEAELLKRRLAVIDDAAQRSPPRSVGNPDWRPKDSARCARAFGAVLRYAPTPQ